MSSSAQPATVPSVVKRVDVCGMKPVTRIITQFGEQFPCCFDYGANYSLIKESVSRKFVGTLQRAIVTLTCIGKSGVLCDSQILSTVTLSGHDVQILLNIIPDDYLNNYILTGRGLLTLGLTVHISRHKLTMVLKPSLVNIYNIDNAVADFQDVDTDILADLKPKLIEFLSCFKN